MIIVPSQWIMSYFSSYLFRHDFSYVLQTYKLFTISTIFCTSYEFLEIQLTSHSSMCVKYEIWRHEQACLAPSWTNLAFWLRSSNYLRAGYFTLNVLFNEKSSRNYIPFPIISRIFFQSIYIFYKQYVFPQFICRIYANC